MVCKDVDNGVSEVAYPVVVWVTHRVFVKSDPKIDGKWVQSLGYALMLAQLPFSHQEQSSAS